MGTYFEEGSCMRVGEIWREEVTGIPEWIGEDVSEMSFVYKAGKCKFCTCESFSGTVGDVGKIGNEFLIFNFSN